MVCECWVYLMGVWALCIPFDTLQCPFKCPQNVIFSEVLYLNTRTFLYVPPRMRARTTVTTPMSIWEPQKAGMPCLNIVGELKAKSAKQERSGLEIYSQFFAKVLYLDTNGVLQASAFKRI